eukprot:1159175-Pelagomonas_calceolata.AAC.14
MQSQNAQEASRNMPVKKEQSNFEMQARCRFWPRLKLCFIIISPIMSGACRKVTRGQSEFSQRGAKEAPNGGSLKGSPSMLPPVSTFQD